MRVGENIEPAELHEKAGMTDPSQRFDAAIRTKKRTVGPDDVEMPAAGRRGRGQAIAPLLEFPFPEAALFRVWIAVVKSIARVMRLRRIVIRIRRACRQCERCERLNC